ELAMMNSFYAVIGTTGLAIIIEIISNLNDNFIQNLLLKKIVIGDTTELRSKAINFVWSSKIYYVVIVTYVIVNIGNIFYFLTGKITIYHMFFGGIVGLTVTLTLYGEFFWLVFSPTIIILYLPKLGLKLDVFDCDMAGGLSPVANYLLKISLMLTLFGTASLYWILGVLKSEEMYIGFLMLITVIILPILYFIIPTIGLRKFMIDQKKEVLINLNERYNNIYQSVITKNLEKNDIEQIQIVEILRKHAMEMREWPFSFAGLRNLITSMILPIGLFLLNNLDVILSSLKLNS
ncbi:MAG: hypothetical protein ACTSR2_12245, partial [Candidatus Hodarchaeales archaeon]